MLSLYFPFLFYVFKFIIYSPLFPVSNIFLFHGILSTMETFFGIKS